ncbi:protein ABSCISIC ACID-INSENSITIVE 5 isoform X2 [Syzygium oleosum]|uniref:protein ABSCISIC ACID-INSENSITIVE 5 isoform X2 n=1 Tax=Syzygium oleosum TaxID=219896 RepID=UPI0024BBB1AD|nr:protein ABSCISIC ACID-INSENSITIVE 5 isoform X2 [Syzygium oleosum]
MYKRKSNSDREMVVSKTEIIPPEEIESELQTDQQPKSHPFSSLGRQSSIYSLTLDEFQHALCESGKNFGSMNMDEFLTSIWNAEENQAVNTSGNNNTTNNSTENADQHVSLGGTSTSKGIAKQPSLPRQGSLTLPAPLCRKTVDEVWSEIHKGQQSHQQSNNVQNPEDAPRQPTFGEMTLEDFLIKAGVVREQHMLHPPPTQQQQHQFGMYQNNLSIGPSFVPRPIMGMGGAAANAAPYQPMAAAIGEASVYPANGKRNDGYATAPMPVSYGQRVRNGSGGGAYGAGQAMGMGVLVNPVSSNGMCGAPVENSGGQFGMQMGGARGGRKRIINGPVDKVVERRQRRMIKNRESAARSRARKQAYTVELEAELNQLKEENAHLKQALAELERKRKQQYQEELRLKAQSQTRAYRAKEKLRMIRRNLSSPL